MWSAESKTEVQLSLLITVTGKAKFQHTWKTDNTRIQISGEYQIKKNEVGGACSTYGGEERCMQGFGGEVCRKEAT
jgi:hypothetical protein